MFVLTDGFAVSFEVPEAELLRDVVFVLQGIDGKYIHYSASKDAYLIDSHV